MIFKNHIMLGRIHMINTCQYILLGGMVKPVLGSETKNGFSFSYVYGITYKVELVVND